MHLTWTPTSANALDGLMSVDLTHTDHKVLKRYMGAEGVQKFMDYHYGVRPGEGNEHSFPYMKGSL